MPEDITWQLTTIGKQLTDELFGRLDVDLSEKDAYAVGTAISKAVTRTANVVAASIPRVKLVTDLPEEIDLWAERFGDDS